MVDFVILMIFTEVHMKILVTNDDGINSEGLAILTRWATKLGEVWVSAPTQQQSGKSHAISIHHSFKINEVSLGLGEKHAYEVDSTPVDCVRFATLGLNENFDLVLSGINKGYNLGEDILYSGTVGALFETSLRSSKGIAFSTEYTTFAAAEQSLDGIYEFFTKYKLLEHNVIYNVNIPLQPKGILLTKQGGAYFSDCFQHLGEGMWQQNGYCVHENNHDLTLDTDATIDGYITVTPMTTQRSNVLLWKKLKSHIK